MGRLLRRRLRCHGCGEIAPGTPAGSARAWRCPYCEALNYVDERGQVADPPVELTARVQPLHLPPARAATPAMPAPAPVESPFCDRCEKNQYIVTQALSEYLPDEDDPDYAKYEASVPQYRASLEQRYPLVCDRCLEPVQQAIRQAGHAAMADNLGRQLEQSKKHRTKTRTPWQTCALVVVTLAYWAYAASVVVRLVWHGFGAIVYFESTRREFSWSYCLSQAVFMREVEGSCVVSSGALRIVYYALAADASTIWWNPVLKKKLNHAHARMHGLVKLWTIRIMVFLLDLVSYLILNEGAVQKHGDVVPDLVKFFHRTHMALFIVLLFATYLGWKTVSIKYISTKALLGPLDSYLPGTPRSTQKQSRPASRSVLPEMTSFDSMADGFASSFPSDPSELNAYPPSPTLTAISTAATEDTEWATPFRRKSTATAASDENAMDWTPTQPRFAAHAPAVIQPQFADDHTSPSKSPSTTKNSPVSIFDTLDQNPFRRRVPAAPKAPLAAKTNPWRKGVWEPLPKERKRNFFEEDKERNRDLGTGLKGRGVPKTVEKEAQLFQPPQFKYDSYTGVKETGLEDTFNNLFSK